MKNFIFIDTTARNYIYTENDRSMDVFWINAVINQLGPKYDLELICDNVNENTIESTLAAARIDGRVNKYVIITTEPELYAGKFISNNIVNVSGMKSPDQLISQVRWILDGFHSPSKNRVFMWSDPHFSHRNIIRYCNRPWNSGKDEAGELIVTDEDVKRMNKDLIKNYNSVVGKDDIVYCLGDFAFGDKNKIPELVSKLNGRIRLIKGNHDRLPNKFYLDAGFDWVYDRPIVINDYVVLSHAPLEFIGPNCPWFNCYGHVHNSESYPKITKHSCCACVEKWDYKPVEFDTIKLTVDELNNKEND